MVCLFAGPCVPVYVNSLFPCSYPVFLRWILSTILWILPRGEYFHYLRETLTFLLEHPRRCYTTLFPSAYTWWLFLSVIVLNGIDWVAYEVLNVSSIMSHLRNSKY